MPTEYHIINGKGECTKKGLLRDTFIHFKIYQDATGGDEEILKMF
jgi:hypothetical protein